jgi:predicted kinase
MATLHLMVGLPCSGKSTRAKQLEAELGALRLTPDEWHIELFGDDVADPDHDRRHNAVEALMWRVASTALTKGLDVILDFGFWARAEREDFAARAAALGAGTKIHFMDVPRDELLARLARRNAEAPEHAFIIPTDDLLGWLARFEPPMADELKKFQ